MSVNYLGVLHPQNVRQLFGGQIYTPKIFDRCGSVKYLGGLHPPKYLTDLVPSNIWGVYTPKIFDGCMSVKYLGGLDSPNV